MWMRASPLYMWLWYWSHNSVFCVCDVLWHMFKWCISPVGISTHFRKMQRQKSEQALLWATVLICTVVQLLHWEYPKYLLLRTAHSDVSNSFMMKTRFVLPAHSTKVPVDMELAASFKMKVLVKFVYCIAKQQDPHQWICWYTVQAENRFHWSLYSK